MTTISIQLKVLNPHQAESITHIPQNISLPSQSQRSRRVGAQFWQFVIHFLFAIACILIVCYSTPSAKSYTLRIIHEIQVLWTSELSHNLAVFWSVRFWLQEWKYGQHNITNYAGSLLRDVHRSFRIDEEEIASQWCSLWNEIYFRDDTQF